MKHAIVPIILNADTPFPRLKDSGIYLAVKMEWSKKKKKRFALIEIPSQFPRFHRISENDSDFIILLDDVIRLNLNAIFSIFKYDIIEAYTFKFTRDAELDLDDDISESFMEKIEKSVKKRKIGEPVRFVYDEQMPADLLKLLLDSLRLELGVNSIPGGKYHNFKDFISFPNFGRSSFSFSKRNPGSHPQLEGHRSVLKSVIKKDVLLHFPYQRFDYIVDLLREAAIDPKVTTIRINVYRVAAHSQIMNALMNAVSNGKDVLVAIELQARFDEEHNLYWANKLKEAGAKVTFGVETLKVHSKLIQIRRIGAKKDALITYVGTGNFHEKTALLYEDIGLLTSNPEIGQEVNRVFDLLDGNYSGEPFNTLIVSPFNVRERLIELINNEIAFAKSGRRAQIRIKLNNLVDSEMIGHLYRASQEGVKIHLLIRGICSLIPGKKGLSENISVRSVVGRYLEHSRFMIFHNNGQKKYFITSADWMERNLDKRVEVGCPVLKRHTQRRLDEIFDTYWKGNVKSRIIDENQLNLYHRDKKPTFNAQDELFRYYKKISDEITATQ